MALGKPPLLANFKTAKHAREKTPRMKRRGLPGNSEQHLFNIRRCRCSIPDCNETPVEAHHLKASGERGGALRSPDRFAVPLCNTHHIHGVETVGSKNELSWFLSRGINALSLATDLWAARLSGEDMKRVVNQHRFGADKL